ncbi:MAG: hypothetical protein KDD89_08605 [Anaerolineales bacterium]|nr:hypothetical protein [Anaerolineales bacterium]
MIATFACMVALALARRVVEVEDELLVEKRLHGEALDREGKALEHVRRLQVGYRRLALRRPMYFAGQPTLDATAYRAESNPIVWWTYDN